jgi:hypothetical protein
MISTYLIKQQQLKNGYFTIGTGQELILVMGSCRVAPYVEYFYQWNIENGNRFTICSIDPFNWNWDANDNRVDYMETLCKLETDERILNLLKSVDIFIHEYYANAGMFNCNKTAEKNIYQFGMTPKQDICIPNFNDYFILASDIISFDTEMRKIAIQDYNVIGKLSEQTQKEIKDLGNKAIEKFYSICLKSDIPEMKDFFEANYKTKRLFWTYNHVSKDFTLAIFNFMNDKFLHLDLSKGFDKDHLDMFANNYTFLSEYDNDFDWNEDRIQLRSKL